MQALTHHLAEATPFSTTMPQILLLVLCQSDHPEIYQHCVPIHGIVPFPACDDAQTDGKAHQHEVPTGTIIVQVIGVSIFNLQDGLRLFPNHLESFILVYPFSFHFILCFIIYTMDNTLLHYIFFVLFFYGRRGRRHIRGGHMEYRAFGPLLQPYHVHIR